MGQPEFSENQRVNASPEGEDHTGTLAMSPPPFQLFADGEEGAGRGGSSDGAGAGADSGGGPIQRQTAVGSPVAQLAGDYVNFPEAVHNLLAPAVSTPGMGDGGYPGTYVERVPGNCYTALWNIFKALHWSDQFGRTARAWAEAAIVSMQDLLVELAENAVPGRPLLAEVASAMSPIINPDSGSAAAGSMEQVLASVIDGNRLVGPLQARQQRAAAAQERYAQSLRSVLPGAANLLTPELNASVPGQILNAASPYNFQHYRGLPGVTAGYLNGLTALYRARWEAPNISNRRQKIRYSDGALRSLFDPRRQTTMLSTLTSLDEAGVATQVAAIQAAIQTHIKDRMAAISADTAITQIARNGAAIPPSARRRAAGGGRARAADPIEYEEGTVVTRWEDTLTPATTVQETRTLFGDEPHMTLFSQNIGPYGGGKYPYVLNSRRYDIVVNVDKPFFGIKYGGGSGLTYRAIDELVADTEHNYFNAEQRLVVQAVRPHVASEGSVSSINTWDAQDLTIAGRGERSRRVSTMVDAAEALMTAFGTPVNLSRVRELVTHLSQTSTTGTAGVRFDMQQIDELVTLLEAPEIHKAMTLAKLNDAILTFHGVGLRAPDRRDRRTGEVTRGAARRYDQDMPAGAEDRLRTAHDSERLHPAIIGVAIHNALGAPAEFGNPMEYAIRANQLYPQRPGYSEAMPDYTRLSQQVAYLLKIRMQNKWNNAHGEPTVSQRYFAVFSQKATDFENYFNNTDLERPGSTFFDMAAATEILPFWTGLRNYDFTTTAPAAGTLFVKVAVRGGFRYYAMGPLLPGAETSLDHRVPTIGAEDGGGMGAEAEGAEE